MKSAINWALNARLKWINQCVQFTPHSLTIYYGKIRIWWFQVFRLKWPHNTTIWCLLRCKLYVFIKCQFSSVIFDFVHSTLLSHFSLDFDFNFVFIFVLTNNFQILYSLYPIFRKRISYFDRFYCTTRPTCKGLHWFWMEIFFFSLSFTKSLQKLKYAGHFFFPNSNELFSFFILLHGRISFLYWFILVKIILPQNQCILYNQLEIFFIFTQQSANKIVHRKNSKAVQQLKEKLIKTENDWPFK